MCCGWLAAVWLLAVPAESALLYKAERCRQILCPFVGMLWQGNSSGRGCTPKLCECSQLPRAAAVTCRRPCCCCWCAWCSLYATARVPFACAADNPTQYLCGLVFGGGRVHGGCAGPQAAHWLQQQRMLCCVCAGPVSYKYVRPATKNCVGRHVPPERACVWGPLQSLDLHLSTRLLEFVGVVGARGTLVFFSSSSAVRVDALAAGYCVHSGVDA